MSDQDQRADPPSSADIDRHVSSVPFNAELGIRYGRSGRGWLENALACSQGLAAPGTSEIAVSVITSLIDATCGAMVLLTCEGVKASVTLNLQVDFVRPAKIGSTLRARADCTELAGQIAYVQARVEDEQGHVIATALGKFLCERGD